MNSNIILVAVCLMLAICVQTSTGIKCYVCNSFYDSDKCATLEDVEQFKFDCSEISAEEAKGFTYTRCRKISQSVQGESRTVRQCATEGKQEDKCFGRTGTLDIKSTYCQCKGDFCNGAPGHMASATNIALLTLISGLVALLLHS